MNTNKNRTLAVSIPFGSARFRLVAELVRHLEGLAYQYGIGSVRRSVFARPDRIIQTEPVQAGWDSIGSWFDASRPKPERDAYTLRTDSPSVGFGSGTGMVPVRKPNWMLRPNKPQTSSESQTDAKRQKSGKTNKSRTRRSGDVWDRRVRETIGDDCYGRSRTDAKLRTEIRKAFIREDGTEAVRTLSVRIGWEHLQIIPQTQAELTEITNKNRTEIAAFVRGLFTNPNKFRVKYWEGILEQFVQDVLGSLCGATPNINQTDRDPFLPKIGSTKQYPNGRPIWLIVYALCSATMRAERKHNIRVRPMLVHIYDGSARDGYAFGKRLDGKANPNKARSLAASRQNVSRTISEIVSQTEAERMSLLSARERQVWVLVGRDMTGKQIANQLGVSPTRVSNLIVNIRRKLGLKNALTQT